MKCIGHALQTYFLTRDRNVQFVSARSKLTVYEGPPIQLKTKSTSDYTVRKHTSIAHARHFLQSQPDMLDVFERLHKKDDAADAYLECLYLFKKSQKLSSALAEFNICPYASWPISTKCTDCGNTQNE